jgi:hypothetical protein
MGRRRRRYGEEVERRISAAAMAVAMGGLSYEASAAGGIGCGRKKGREEGRRRATGGKDGPKWARNECTWALNETLGRAAWTSWRNTYRGVLIIENFTVLL